MKEPQLRYNSLRVDHKTKLLPKLGVEEKENATYRECYIKKIEHIIPLANQSPFITWISGNMFLYPPYKRYEPASEQQTNGLWGNSDDPRINRSICQLAMISRPTDKELEVQEAKYGYHMGWPPPMVQRWLPNSMKHFTKEKEQGKYASILFFQAVGIVNPKTGVYLRKYGHSIAGYFIMSLAEGAEQERKVFIDQQPLWYRKQYCVAVLNYVSHQERIIARSQKAIERASVELPYHDVYTRSMPKITEELMEDLPSFMVKTLEKYKQE